MEHQLNITGLFTDEEELRATIRKRKMCYDTEPYYLPNKQGSLTQIGFQINLYGTFPDTALELSAKRQAFGEVLRDVRRVAEALKKTGEALHMGELVIPDSTSVSFSDERKRPEEHLSELIRNKVSEILRNFQMERMFLPRAVNPPFVVKFKQTTRREYRGHSL